MICIKIIIHLISNMKRSLAINLDTGSFLKSRPITSKDTTISRKSSRKYYSMDKISDNKHKQNQEEESLEIYFDKTKRKTYLKSIIDNYFGSKQQNSVEAICRKYPSFTVSQILRQGSHSSKSYRRPKFHNIRPHQVITKNLIDKMTMSDYKTPNEINHLPTIQQDLTVHKRPFSQYKISRISNDKDMEESLLYDSNKSLYDNIYNESQEIQSPTIKNSVSRIGKSNGKFRIFDTQNNQQLKRELIIKKLGMDVLWKSNHNQKTLEYPLMKNLKQLCYSLIQNNQNGECVYNIYPTAYYSQLFANNCQELKDIIASMAKVVANEKGKISNNQINMQNIIKMAQKQFYLADWGCSASQDQLKVQEKVISREYTPYCKEDKRWLLIPEYLSPELLKAVKNQDYTSIWTQKGGISACDIWSIGCLLVELITLVPLWATGFCTFKGRGQRYRGLLGCKIRTADNIIVKQKCFRSNAIRRIREQQKTNLDFPKINENILILLSKMLEQSPQKRIGPAQILQHLK